MNEGGRFQVVAGGAVWPLGVAAWAFAVVGRVVPTATNTGQRIAPPIDYNPARGGFTGAKSVLVIVAAILLAPWPAYGQTRITGDNIAFFIYAWLPDDVDKLTPLVPIVSWKYQNAEDEFARKREFEAAIPDVERRLRDARQSPRVYHMKESRLMDYDFDRKAFPMELATRTTFSAGPNYRDDTFIIELCVAPTSPMARSRSTCTGSNILDMRARIGHLRPIYIPTGPEDAESLAPYLRGSRRVTVRVDGIVDRARGARQLIVRAQKIKVWLRSSNIEVGTVSVPFPSLSEETPEEQE